MWSFNRLSIRPKPRKLKLWKLERFSEDRINMHKNAPTDAARSRADGSGDAERADAGGRRTSRRRLPADGAQVVETVRGGRLGRAHIDRSSRPRKLRRPTPAAVREEIVALRRQRLCGKHIAKRVGVSPATVPELLDRLAEFCDLDRDLIQALEARRSSFYRWKFKGHRPNPQSRAKIYHLAVHHGLIAAAPPTLTPRSQPGRRPKPESETMGWAEKLFFGIGAAALIGALAAALIRAA
jgi:hypothetical protein